MNSSPILPDAATAVAALEAWFDTVRTPEGVTGPAVAFRSNCLNWCGAGFDWRYEGLLEGRILRAKATGDSAHLDVVAHDVQNLLAAQRGDGSFRNSYFEWNPFEGGMPHEPAVLASALRARKALATAGRDVPGLAEAVTSALDGRYMTLLWNKTLRTVRDWEITDYQFGPSISAAAVLDVILEWTEWQGNWDVYETRAKDLAAWIRLRQESEAALDGGIHTSNRRGGGISPFYSSRCLGPLHRYAVRTGCEKSREAVDRLIAFLIKHQRPEGGFHRLLWDWRPASINPLHTGMTAAILAALLPFDALSESDLQRQENWLLSFGTPTGAFRNAVGYGRLHPSVEKSEWRDWLPSPGWQDKLYLYFSHRAADSRASFVPQEWEIATNVRHRAGSYRESPDAIEIRKGDEPVFQWNKKSDFPLLCRLT